MLMSCCGSLVCDNCFPFRSSLEIGGGVVQIFLKRIKVGLGFIQSNCVTVHLKLVSTKKMSRASRTSEGAGGVALVMRLAAEVSQISS